MDATELYHELQELELQNTELRATQRALEESRRGFADLFDFAPVAYFTLSRSGYIQEVNLAGAALLERPRVQLLDRPFAQVARLERGEAFFSHLEHCWASRERTVSELTLVTAAGRPRVVQMESAPLAATAGQPAAIRTTMSDITALKEAERSLRQAAAVERELRQRIELLASAAVSISEELVLADLDGVLRAIVEQARALVGVDAAAVGLRACGEGAFNRFVSSGLDGEHADRLRRGEEAPGMLAVDVRCRGEVCGRLFVAAQRGRGELSVEDRRLVETLASRIGPAVEIARLREQESRERGRLELYAEASAISTLTLDFDEVLDAIAHLALPRMGDCCVVYVSEGGVLRQAAAAHVDASLEPLLRRAHAGMMSLPGPPISLTERAFQSGQVVLAPDFDLCGYSERIPEEWMADLRKIGPRSVVALPLRGDGHVVGVATLAWCRPDRRYEDPDVVFLRAMFERAALALENARLYRDLGSALEAREDMLAVVAHDLRNPLSSIRVNASLLQRQLSDEASRACVARQEQAAKSMLRLVDDLLDAAALDAGAVTLELDQHPLATLVEQAIASVAAAAERRRVRIESSGDGGLTVRCDAQRIVQVLSNLLANAIKFSPEGGVVRLSVGTDGTRVWLAISDDGPGIRPELRDNLFRRFWKGQKLGTGLGLYIAKRIVDAHGGQLGVESTPGHGATFSVVL